MQLFNGRLTARLTEEDKDTISTWRKRMIAFYSVLFIITSVFVAIDMRDNKYVADDAGKVSALAASVTK